MLFPHVKNFVNYHCVRKVRYKQTNCRFYASSDRKVYINRIHNAAQFIAKGSIKWA